MFNVWIVKLQVLNRRIVCQWRLGCPCGTALSSPVSAPSSGLHAHHRFDKARLPHALPKQGFRSALPRCLETPAVVCAMPQLVFLHFCRARMAKTVSGNFFVSA